MAYRFYLPELKESGTVQLDGTEAHHLMHVLRQKAGDSVELFDGLGLVAQGVVSSLKKREALIEIVSVSRVEALTREVVLATAVPKGDRFEWLVEKATELGVSRLIPLVTRRSVDDPRDSKLDKLRNAMIAACKQSRRNLLMPISPVTSICSLLAAADADRQFLIAHPSGRELKEILDQRPLASQNITALIGPEGGFADDEIQCAADAGAIPITLGHNILRIETAAVAIAARLLL